MPEVRLAALWRGRRPAHRAAPPEIAITGRQAKNWIRGAPDSRAAGGRGAAEVLGATSRESEEPRFPNGAQAVDGNRRGGKKSAAQAALVVPQGTPWKVLDLAKLEPQRRNGSRALNVAALLADFPTSRIERTLVLY